MSTYSYVGVHDPDQPGHVRLRYVHSGVNRWFMIATLRTIWANAAAGDTHRLATMLLAYDWDYLDPAVTDSSTPAFAGGQLIAGVGRTLAAGTAGGLPLLPHQPVTVVALAATAHLDAQWIYLLDPGTDTLTVHTSGGDLVSREPLAS
ncbi:hypothetical protein ACQP2X_39605 [Actinoplanes sp. CA-131856]